MSEPLRTAPADHGPATDADREALIEKLLLAGLDHYFGGRYEQAVNVWTRVAFLERGHGRARAYIERARGALAEQQRESEELLHNGVEAYKAGDLRAARELLTRALAEGGANETALMFLQRLGHSEAATQPPPTGTSWQRSPRGGLHAEAASERTNWVSTVLVSAAIVAVALLLTQPIASWLGELPVAVPVVRSERIEPLPIVRGSEVRMARAREMHSSGRLRDALQLLNEIDIADPLRQEADELKAVVQRDLLATAAPTPSAAPGESPAEAGEAPR
jgi:hypothetical protein